MIRFLLANKWLADYLLGFLFGAGAVALMWLLD